MGKNMAVNICDDDKSENVTVMNTKMDHFINCNAFHTEIDTTKIIPQEMSRNFDEMLHNKIYDFIFNHPINSSLITID
jgi:hypothetical protein